MCVPVVSATLYSVPFGECCEDLRNALHDPPDPLIRVEVDGTLFMAVGYARTNRGVGWFDHAVLFCPFCGAPLQTVEEIRHRAEVYRAGQEAPGN
jgi:hypothetical protein